MYNRLVTIFQHSLSNFDEVHAQLESAHSQSTGMRMRATPAEPVEELEQLQYRLDSLQCRLDYLSKSCGTRGSCLPYRAPPIPHAWSGTPPPRTEPSSKPTGGESECQHTYLALAWSPPSLLLRKQALHCCAKYTTTQYAGCKV